MGVNTADGDFNTVEKTGGEKTESHLFKIMYKGYVGALVGGDEDMIQAYSYLSGSNGFHSYEGEVQTRVNTALQVVSDNRGVSQFSTVGETNQTSILQPYITCYIWKRTA